MIRILFIALILYPSISFNQHRRFYKAIDSIQANLTEEWGASGADVDVLNFEQQNYEGAVLDHFNKLRRVKNRTTFIQDSAYNRMCLTGISTFSKKFYYNGRLNGKAHRYTEIGLRRMQGDNRLFRVLLFKVDLLDVGNRERFYFDRRNHDSELQLYKGPNPLTRNTEHEDYVEPIPLDKLSELDFVENFQKMVRREIGPQEFYSKNFTHMGIAMRLDPNSIGKRRIPRAFVMVILGGKQSQKIKKARPIPERNAADNNPYTILK